MKEAMKAKIKSWVDFCYKPLLLVVGFTKNKVDNIALPVLKSFLDKILSPK